MMMVIFESHLTAYLYRRKPETEVLSSLAGAVRWVLLLYLVMRFSDLVVRGQAHYLIAADVRTFLFWFEICVLAIFPAVLFWIPRVRASRGGQWSIAALGVFGVVFNRIDTGGLAHLRPTGEMYVPSWNEVAISVAIVSGAALLFLFIMERFHVWEERPVDPEAQPARLPEFNKIDATWLGVPAISARTVYSLAAIVAAAVGFGMISAQAGQRSGVDPVPVHQARGGDVLWIDGNLDGFGVSFKHEEHKKRWGDKQSCVLCHHLNLPGDRDSACSRCHRQMYRSVDAFRHDWHASPRGANLACYRCHAAGQVRSAKTAAPCDSCHKSLLPAGALIQVKTYEAPGYVEALHRTCVGCHRKEAVKKNKPEMAQCAWCHKEKPQTIEARELILRRQSSMSGSPILPPAGN
jgi:hypothetical protein